MGGAMVKIIMRDREWDVAPGSTVRDVMVKLGLDPEAVLAVRQGQLINEATLTKDGDTIKLIAVVSGG
jgi:sulfur carrier protein ThiS